MYDITLSELYSTSKKSNEWGSIKMGRQDKDKKMILREERETYGCIEDKIKRIIEGGYSKYRIRKD